MINFGREVDNDDISDLVSIDVLNFDNKSMYDYNEYGAGDIIEDKIYDKC